MHIGREWGDSWRAGYHIGFDKVNHFFSKRNMIAFSYIFSQIKNNPVLLAGFLSTLTRGSIRNRYMPQYGNRHVGALSGTLYIPTYTEDSNVIKLFSNRVKAIKRGLIIKSKSKSFIQSGEEFTSALNFSSIFSKIPAAFELFEGDIIALASFGMGLWTRAGLGEIVYSETDQNK